MYQAVIPATGQSFRIGKIVCVGRNYSEHIKELGNQIPASPVLFMKPATSLLADGGEIVIPAYSHDCHHEVELAVLIGSTCKRVEAARVMEHVAGYGVAIDLTLRDVQNSLKEQGLPWEIAKAFDTSCPLSLFVPRAAVADPHQLSIRLAVNGSVRQDATTALMLRRIPELIEAISAIFTLEAGDVVLTGTPAGVGPIVAGDRLHAEIASVGTLDVSVR